MSTHKVVNLCNVPFTIPHSGYLYYVQLNITREHDKRPSNLQERMTTKTMLKPVKRLVFQTTETIENE